MAIDRLDESLDARTDVAVLSYLRVDHESLPESDIAGGESIFALSDDALPAGISGEDVTVYRYHDGQWSALETTYADGRVTATTPGFSLFAIGYPADTEPETTTSESTTSSETAPTSQPTSVSGITDATTTADATTASESTTPTTAVASRFGTTALIGGLILIGLLGLGLWYRRR